MGRGAGLLSNSQSLQIVLHPGPNAIERFLDVFDRVRDAETQIALAKIAKCGTRQRSDASVVEQRIGEFLRWPPGLRDVGENVERTLRQAAGETFDLVETGDHHVAPFLEFDAHLV